MGVLGETSHPTGSAKPDIALTICMPMIRNWHRLLIRLGYSGVSQTSKVASLHLEDTGTALIRTKGPPSDSFTPLIVDSVLGTVALHRLCVPRVDTAQLDIRTGTSLNLQI